MHFSCKMEHAISSWQVGKVTAKTISFLLSPYVLKIILRVV